MNIKQLKDKFITETLILNFVQNDAEYELLYLVEAKKAAKSASSDTKGKLHELLVGYHLKGDHMTKHQDITGESPKQVHDRLRDQIHPDEYKKIHKRAKTAAAHIREEHLKAHGDVHDVHWSSKPGDIHRSTGVHSSQKEDASDIIIHTRRGKKITHHGVSLKVSDSSNKHVPVSNPGIESTYGGAKILESHRRHILKKFPKLRNKGSAERREIMEKHPRIRSYIRGRNTKTLKRITSHLHGKLSEMSGKDLAHHIKTHVLQSHPTPLQREGHHHIRHMTYHSGGEQKHHSYDPSTAWSHMIDDHKNLSVHKSGTRILFKHKDKTFAVHRMKFTSQSDPHSSIKGSGSTVGEISSPSKLKKVMSIKKKRKK